MSQPINLLEQYYGLWAIFPTHMPDQVSGPPQGWSVADGEWRQQQWRGCQEELGDSARTQEMFELGYARRGSTAVMQIRGVMSKYGGWYSASGSTVVARQTLAKIARDETVDRVLMVIESPGGQVAGNLELAKDVAQLTKTKPVTAYIEDLGASAAYEVAAQASRVFANESALVGSIGTYMVVYDMSELAEGMGVKAHLITTGPFKGAGTPGTQVTDEQLANWQTLVNSMNDQFLEAIAKGRDIPRARVETLADGRVHMAKDAQALGLIDGVMSLSDVLAAMDGDTTEEGSAMADTTTNAESPATITELEAACQGASAEFILGQVKAGATVAEAVTAYAADLRKQLADRDAAMEQARAEAAAREAKAAEEAAAREEEEHKRRSSAVGSDPLATEVVEDDDAGPVYASKQDEFVARVDEFMATKPRDRRTGQLMTRREAAVFVHKQLPGDVAKEIRDRHNETHGLPTSI